MTAAGAPAWDALREQWELDGFDESFARLMWRLAGPGARPSLAPAVCALGRGLARGQGCIDLAEETTRSGCAAGAGAGTAALTPAAWRRELLATAVVGQPGEHCPLVLDAHNRLYLYRYWHYEQQLAQRLSARAATLLPEPAGLAQALQELFAPGPGMDAARLAAATAVRRRACIISGGPGTGKTVTAVRILALLLRLAGDAPPCMALAAPTGKAAVRLQAAVQAALQYLPAGPYPRLDALLRQAGTLHRLLGARPDGSFRHGPDQPLPPRRAGSRRGIHDRPCPDVAAGACPAGACTADPSSVIGDQLASVAPGAVFHALCQSPAPRRASAPPPGDDRSSLPASGTAAGTPAAPAPLGDCTVILRHNFRFPADSGIAALAAAVCRGDAQAALDVLAAAPADLGFHALADAAVRLPAECLARAPAALYMPEDLADTDAALACLSRFRILAVQREGAWGVSDLNAHVRGQLGVDQTWYPGRQVLILQNRPELNLYKWRPRHRAAARGWNAGGISFHWRTIPGIIATPTATA